MEIKEQSWSLFKEKNHSIKIRLLSRELMLEHVKFCLFSKQEKLAKMSKYVNHPFLYQLHRYQQILQHTKHLTISIFIITSPTIRI